MPMITIKYDDAEIDDKKILDLSHAIRDIISRVTDIKDVFVYADSPRIKVYVAPVEIFISMNEHKISDLEKLFSQVKEQLVKWKKENNVKYPINLTIIPMKWKLEVDI